MRQWHLDPVEGFSPLVGRFASMFAVLHHLMQHEAEHRGQIGEIRVALLS